jgi:hypothetical protein
MSQHCIVVATNTDHYSQQSLFDLATGTTHPPTLPVPGQKRDENAVKSPSSIAIKQVFAAFCKLWTIVAEVSFIYRHRDTPKVAAFAFAQSRYQKLMNLSDSFSGPMSRISDESDQPAYALVFQ